MSDVVSANWDALIESALKRLAEAPAAILKVIVLGNEFRGPVARTRLLKFHGCAVLAGQDPAKYRASLIGRYSQVTGWPDDDASAAMRESMRTLAVTRPTLMIGLSAQDTNIQAVFSQAQSVMPWDWPEEVPAHIFAGDTLGEIHQNILRVVYRQAYDADPGAIESGSLIRAYAKPLLVALVLDVLAIKAYAAARTAEAPGLSPLDLEAIKEGLWKLRDHLASFAGTGTLDFINGFLARYRRLVALFQHGLEPPPDATFYRPLLVGPADLLGADLSAIATSGVPEISAALGLLGRGQAAGTWTVDVGSTATGTHGALCVRTPGYEAAVFFAASSRAAVQLEVGGTISSSTADAIVIHSSEPVSRRRRSPRNAFGRAGQPGPRHVPMDQLLRDSASIGDLERAFRLEGALDAQRPRRARRCASGGLRLPRDGRTRPSREDSVRVLCRNGW